MQPKSSSLLMGVVFALFMQGRAPAAEACDRQCLEAMLDAYVDALIVGEPERLPLSAAVKFTENGQRLVPGDGLWNTATGAGRYALRLTDPESGQAVLLGTIREADRPTVLVVRLKVFDLSISEIETLVIREQQVAERLDAIGTPRAIWYEPIPEHERLPRLELVSIANEYFSGIERNNGQGDYPISQDCARLENGMVTAGDPARVSAAAPPRADGSAPGCLEQFESGVFYYVTRIRDRRFTLVDPERGLAFAFAFFDNAAGDARFGTLANGRAAESGPDIPWTWQIAEVFRIERGLIGPVESVLHSVPYGTTSGWSDWDAAMSSEPQY